MVVLLHQEQRNVILKHVRTKAHQTEQWLFLPKGNMQLLMFVNSPQQLEVLHEKCLVAVEMMVMEASPVVMVGKPAELPSRSRVWIFVYFLCLMCVRWKSGSNEKGVRKQKPKSTGSHLHSNLGTWERFVTAALCCQEHSVFQYQLESEDVRLEREVNIRLRRFLSWGKKYLETPQKSRKNNDGWCELLIVLLQTAVIFPDHER